MQHDPVLFAETFFSVGKGWLYEGQRVPDFGRSFLQRLSSESLKTLDLVPRGHLKTTLTRIWVLWQICYRKADNLLILAGSDGNKQAYREAIQTALTNHLKFSMLHWFLPYFFAGKSPIEKDNEDFLRLPNGCRVFYRSVMSKNRGLNVEGRPDVVVFDDIYGDDARDSASVRDRITDTMVSSVEFLGEMGCRFRAVGTTIHTEDFWSKIVSGDIGGWDYRVLEAHDDEYTHILWPERYPDKTAFLRLQEEVYIPLNRMHLYNAEMRNQPGTKAAQPFAGMVFPRYTTTDWRALHRVMYIDNAGGGGGDDFVIALTGNTHRYQGDSGQRDDVYVLDIFAENEITLRERYEQIERRIKRWEPHHVGIGMTSESRDFTYGLREYLKERGIYIGIHEYSEATPKNARIIAHLEYSYSIGRVQHRAGAPWLNKLENQLRRFDSTKKHQDDDILDALAKCLHKTRPAEKRDALPPRPRDAVLGQLYDTMHGTGPGKAEPIPGADLF
jgi:predicted phage terminase large subunit-like protein